MGHGKAQPSAHVSALLLISMLGAGVVVLTVLSDRFDYASSPFSRPLIGVVCILVSMGIAYLALAALLTTRAIGTGVVTAGIVAGLVMRFVFMSSSPIQEDDFLRYLWDGAVTASGHSPYRFSPAEIARDDEGVPAELRELRDQYIGFDRINFPRYTTIYPPAAQAAFAVAYFIRPFKFNAWRFVVLLLDLATLWLVRKLLDSAGAPRQRLLIYWLNPILLLEAYNSAHMDVVALPFVAAAALFVVRHRAFAGAGALAFAIAAKLWPVLLAPLLLRSLNLNLRETIKAVAFGAGATVLLMAPMLLHVGRADTGLAEYGRRWEMNDALFMPLRWACTDAVLFFGLDEGAGEVLARVLVGVISLGAVAALSVKPITGTLDLCNRAGIAIGVLFMLSPTQFPWYYLWMLPFLAVRPRASLLLLSATLPLYYLKFHYAAHQDVEFFHTRVVWFEFGPVLLVAAWEAWRAWRRHTAPAT